MRLCDDTNKDYHKKDLLDFLLSLIGVLEGVHSAKEEYNQLKWTTLKKIKLTSQ